MELLNKLYTQVKDELENNILPFWNNLKDENNGGFYGFVDYNLNIDINARKGVILNSRILWFYSNVYLTLGNEQALLNAKHAYEFLINNCYDKKNGGVYWIMSSDGEPIEDMKHTYNLAFAIYGLSSYYAASHDKKALELAYQLFDTIEDKCVDEYGYLEAFDREWNIIGNDKLSEDGYSASKTMNTLLHIIEAYTELYWVDKNDMNVALNVTLKEKVLSKIKNALTILKEKVFNEKKGMLEVFFDEKMNSIADIYSYGHDIEASWLIDRACSVIGDKKLSAEMRKITDTIADNSLKTAFKNGAMNNESCRGEVDTTRIWWVEAESVLGCLNAYKKTNDEKYLNIALQIWDYIKTYVIDKREGSEWFGYVGENGVPIEHPIVEPWKCPYHNGRMCIEIIRYYSEIL